MALPKITFSHPGNPCGSSRIRQMEKDLNRQLPADYAEFIMQTGGGILSLKNTYLTGIDLPSGATLEANVDLIFGNAPFSNKGIDLAEYGAFLAQEWEIPVEVLLIGHTESGMHECFAINYDLQDFPRHSILYLNNDIPGQFTLVAETFNEFLCLLGPDEDYDPEKEQEGSTQKLQDDIFRSQNGALSPQLKESIEATGITDYEQIVRRAAYELAGVNLGFSVWGSNDKWLQLLDVVYWAAQHVQPSPSLTSFKGPFWEDTPWDGNKFQYPSLIRTSFVLDGELRAVFCSEAMIHIW